MLAEKIRVHLLREATRVCVKVMRRKPLILLRFAKLPKERVAEVMVLSSDAIEITYNVKQSLTRQEWLHFTRHEVVHFLRMRHKVALNRWLATVDENTMVIIYDMVTKIFDGNTIGFARTYTYTEMVEEVTVETIARLLTLSS